MTTPGVVFAAVQPQDIETLARVHREAFPGFFLSRLGEPFLVQFYRGFLDDDSAVTVVARAADGRVIGAAVGTTEPDGFFRRLLRRRWRQFGLEAARCALRSPATAPRLLRAVRYRGGDKPPDAGALISSICVIPSAKGTGLGRRLLSEWSAAARRAGAEQAFLTTDAEGNDAVNRFYRAEGWTLSDTFRTPEGRVMNHYRRSLGVQC